LSRFAQKSSEDFEAQAAAGDLRTQYVIFTRHVFAAHKAIADALEKFDEMMNYFLVLAENGCPDKGGNAA
jgi:hypothetical protein